MVPSLFNRVKVAMNLSRRAALVGRIAHERWAPVPLVCVHRNLSHGSISTSEMRAIEGMDTLFPSILNAEDFAVDAKQIQCKFLDVLSRMDMNNPLNGEMMDAVQWSLQSMDMHWNLYTSMKGVEKESVLGMALQCAENVYALMSDSESIL